MLMHKVVKCGRSFAGLFFRRVCQILGKVLPVLMNETVKSGRSFAGLLMERI